MGRFQKSWKVLFLGDGGCAGPHWALVKMLHGAGGMGFFCFVLTREGWYDENARSMLTCLDLSVGGAANPMMQLKVTALMAAELCVSTMGQRGNYSASVQSHSLQEPTHLPSYLSGVHCPLVSHCYQGLQQLFPGRGCGFVMIFEKIQVSSP